MTASVGRAIMRATAWQTTLVFAVLQGFAQQAPDPVIEMARAAATAYQRSLPDYIVKRTTTRFSGVRGDLRMPARSVAIWQTMDTVSGEVAAVHGHELYSNITVNGKSVSSLPSRGAWTAGEFSTELQAILPAERSAVFSHQRGETMRGRPAIRYDFAVNVEHSAWHLAANHLPGTLGPETYLTAYGGAIWIDKATGEVLRIEMSALDLPKWFSLYSIESLTDFDFVKIGEEKYVLPTRSVSLTCERHGPVCLKNDTVFRDYDKFGSKTSISFDTGK